MYEDVLKSIRKDSLSKHDGMTKRYSQLDIDSCVQIIINRDVQTNKTKVVFEEHDGYGHGLNVPSDWILEDHIGGPKDKCPRCFGAGKIIINGEDCTECKGTGMVPKDVTVKAMLS